MNVYHGGTPKPLKVILLRLSKNTQWKGKSFSEIHQRPSFFSSEADAETIGIEEGFSPPCERVQQLDLSYGRLTETEDTT